MWKKGILAWTTDQVNVYLLLKEGKTYEEISASTGLGMSSITKVTNAVKNGQVPPASKIQGQSGSSGQVKVSPQSEVTKTVQQYGKAVEESQSEDGSHESGEDGEGGEKKGITPVVPQDIASVIKLITVPVNCALTPIMVNARLYCTVKLGWNAHMPWENFFDTCLNALFQSWGVVLQGWYELDDEDPGHSLKPSWVNPELAGQPGGNGHGNEAVQKLAESIAEYINEVVKKGG